MSWAGLAGNRPVSNENLQDAVTNNVFTLKAGQTIPVNEKCITRSQANTLLNIETITNDGKLALKSELVAVSPYYLAGYAFESDNAPNACSLITETGGFNIYTVNSGGFFDTDDTIYIYYGGSYYPLSSDYPYIAYYSNYHEANIWLDHGGIGVVVLGGTC